VDLIVPTNNRYIYVKTVMEPNSQKKSSLESFGRKFPNLANLLNLFLYYTNNLFVFLVGCRKGDVNIWKQLKNGYKSFYNIAQKNPIPEWFGIFYIQAIFFYKVKYRLLYSDHLKNDYLNFFKSL
jgi:hypothetical protein